MEEFLNFVEANAIKILAYGGGGLVLAFVIKLLLMGANGKWRWQK